MPLHVDTTQWRSVGPRGPAGGTGPPCAICGVSTWVELAGGFSDDAYHPNIDKRHFPTVDIVHNFQDGRLPVLHDGHAERVKIIDVINYLTQDAARVLMREVFRLLRPGGSFYIRAVDLQWLCQRIGEDGPAEEWLSALFHSPDTVSHDPEAVKRGYPDEGEGIHRWGYSFRTLKEELEAAGFVNIRHDGYYNRVEVKVEAFKPHA